LLCHHDSANFGYDVILNAIFFYFLVELAKTIPDEIKKDFCSDTREAFHGEFARLISVPMSLSYNMRFFLFAEEEFEPELYATLKFVCMKLDNAKAQFKCPNPFCQHAWTSMRARISFSITDPIPGFIILKIFGQDCQRCGTNADALWYIGKFFIFIMLC